MEHGVLDTPVEYLCEIGHVQARYLGLLEDWEVEDWKERIRRLTGQRLNWLITKNKLVSP
jgi:hypothetical protein